jgi:integrase
VPKRKIGRRQAGEGSIYWDGSRYVAAIALGRDAAGRRSRRYVYGPRGDDSKLARLSVSEALAAVVAQRARPQSRDTLGGYIEAWLAHEDHLRESTAVWYRSIFTNHIASSALAAAPIANLSPKRIKAFYESLTVGAPTRRAVHALIHRVLEQAVELEDLQRNPASPLRKPHHDRADVATLGPDEQLLFERLARRSPYYALYVLALTTTMGPAELFGLHVADVHLNEGFLIVAHDLVEVRGRVSITDVKNKFRRRRIDLPLIAIRALRVHLQSAQGPLVFSAPRGGLIYRGAFNRGQWKPFLAHVTAVAERFARWKRQKPEYRFPQITMYGLRHSCNALMGYLGVPIEVARERMGHSSITMTADTYGHNYKSLQTDVATRMDAFFGQR